MDDGHVKQEKQNQNENQKLNYQQITKKNNQEDEDELVIIGGEECNKQMLLINASSEKVYQINGQVICSSDKSKGSQGYLNFMNFGLRRIEGKDFGFKIVTKNPPYIGKILMLNTEIYEENFFFDKNYLLYLNFDSNEYTMRKHWILKNLQMITPTKHTEHAIIVLQGRSERSIMQKTLAFDEEMELPNGRVIAMSQYVFVDNSRNKFKGPGIIFFQPETKFKMNKNLVNLLKQNLFLILFLVIMTLVEKFYAG